VSGQPVWATFSASWDVWAFTALLLAGVPLLARRLYASLASIPKVRIYAAVIAMQWCLSALLLLVVRCHALGLADLGMQAGLAGRSIAIAAVCVIAFAALAIRNARRLKQMDPAKLASGLGRGRLFYPHDSGEMTVFVLLALTTGACEELLYRGWLVNLVAALGAPIWIAVLLAAIAFGIGHAYQGAKGMVATGILGFIFGAIYVVTSSLFAGQVFHVAINLANGVVGAYALTLLRPLPLQR